MSELFKAVKAKWDATPALVNVAKLYNTIAPQNKSFPYAAMTLVSNTLGETFNTKLDDSRLQFSLFSKSSSFTEVKALYAALIAAFDNAALTYDNQTHVAIYRDTDLLVKEPGDENVWHYMVEYKIWYQEP